MIEAMIAQVFETNQQLWKVGDNFIVPDEQDITDLLDDMVKFLQDQEIGTRVETAGIIVEKLQTGHDVYVHVGTTY